MDSLLSSSRASPIAQQVKNLPAMQETQETWIQSLGGEDPLEKEMATHSNILAWKIPGTEDPGGQKAKGSQRDRHNWVTKHHTCIRFFQVFSCLYSSHSASGCRRKNIYNMMDGWRMMGSGLPERPELLSFLVGFTLSVRALLFCADSHHICLRLTAFGSTADQGLPCWMLWPCASGEARDLPGSVLSVINILPRVYIHPQSISFNLSFVIQFRGVGGEKMIKSHLVPSPLPCPPCSSPRTYSGQKKFLPVSCRLPSPPPWLIFLCLFTRTKCKTGLPRCHGG